MTKVGLASAVARSAVLAVVSAGLTALVVLLMGAVTFAVRVRMGRADALSGFEPNFFMRQIGLPVAAIVFLGAFLLSLLRFRSELR
jgi:hypothetical protein